MKMKKEWLEYIVIMVRAERERLYVAFYCSVKCLRILILFYNFMPRRDFKKKRDMELHNLARFNIFDILKKY